MFTNSFVIKYSEEEAEKAFNKTKDEKKVSDQDIEFSREK